MARGKPQLKLKFKNLNAMISDIIDATYRRMDGRRTNFDFMSSARNGNSKNRKWIEKCGVIFSN